MDLNNDHGKILGEVLGEFYPQDLTYIMVDINDLVTKFHNGQRFGKYKVTIIEKNKNDDIYKIETFEKYLSIETDVDEYDAIFPNNFETVDELREFIKGFVEICNTHLGENIRRKSK